jgi:hypothetical protein
MLQFQPLGYRLHIQLGYASDVAARSVHASDETKLDRVATRFEGNWNGGVRGLYRQCGRSACRGNYGRSAMNQIGRHRGQPVISALCPTVSCGDALGALQAAESILDAVTFSIEAFTEEEGLLAVAAVEDDGLIPRRCGSARNSPPS